jgi:hypothetical protein
MSDVWVEKPRHALNTPLIRVTVTGHGPVASYDHTYAPGDTSNVTPRRVSPVSPGLQLTTTSGRTVWWVTRDDFFRRFERAR